MEQPKGFEEPGKEDWVWELHKGLYGMKQGGRLWNKHMDTRMKAIGFTQLSVEHCIYYRKRESGVIFAAVHVDDFTVAASSSEEEFRFEEELRAEWQISRADANFIVGWAIRRDRTKHTCISPKKPSSTESSPNSTAKMRILSRLRYLRTRDLPSETSHILRRRDAGLQNSPIDSLWEFSCIWPYQHVPTSCTPSAH
jgi:hypothetical protein